MSDERSNPTLVRSCANHRWSAITLLGALLVGGADAAADDNTALVRDLASRVGPVLGSALACRNIAQPRVQVVLEKFRTVIWGVSSAESYHAEITRLLERYMDDGRGAVSAGKIDCSAAERQMADLEQSIGIRPAGPSLADAFTAPPIAKAATSPTQPLPPSNVHGVTDREIRFGTVIPYTGGGKENGYNTRLGIEAAFDRANDTGGVNGRMLKLIPADDGYEPSRTLGAMKELWDKEQVFGFIGNNGTPTAAVALPFALEQRVLFFGPLTGAGVVRHDPPDRYVFNYRASYSEETDAAVRYLVKIRKLRPSEIAVFAQNDAYGDAGFAGVAKAFRALGVNDGAILRVNYARNTIDVDDAVNQLRLQRSPIRAVVMTATTRAAARFIEKTRDQFPGMVYTNVSAVGATALASELMLLGPRFTENVIVTQTVPAVSGYSSLVLEYKSAMAKYFPGEAPDYISLESFVMANVLIDALRRCGPQLDTEKLVDELERTHNLDLGLGTPLSFSRSEHQASHKVWGTALDQSGKFQAIELE